MGHNIHPSRPPCRAGGYAKSKDGRIDCQATACAFKGTGCPRVLRDGDFFCWLDGEVLYHELEAIGEKRLARTCYESYFLHEAEILGAELLHVAAKLRKRYAGVPPEKRPHGAGHNLSFDGLNMTRTGPFTTFDEVLRIVEAGGRWYQKVASAGVGVTVRY